jgi:hypothetical protein
LALRFGGTHRADPAADRQWAIGSRRFEMTWQADHEAEEPASQISVGT